MKDYFPKVLGSVTYFHFDNPLGTVLTTRGTVLADVSARERDQSGRCSEHRDDRAADHQIDRRQMPWCKSTARMRTLPRPNLGPECIAASVQGDLNLS